MISKIIFKNKKIYFDIFLSEKHLKKQLLHAFKHHLNQ